MSAWSCSAGQRVAAGTLPAVIVFRQRAAGILPEFPNVWQSAARRSRNPIVLLLVLVLDCPISDSENEDDDEDERFAPDTNWDAALRAMSGPRGKRKRDWPSERHRASDPSPRGFPRRPKKPLVNPQAFRGTTEGGSRETPVPIARPPASARAGSVSRPRHNFPARNGTVR